MIRQQIKNNVAKNTEIFLIAINKSLVVNIMSSSYSHIPDPTYGSMKQPVEMGHRWLDEYTYWQSPDIRILKQLPSIYQIKKRQQRIDSIANHQTANHQIQRGGLSEFDLGIDSCWSQKFMPREFA